MDVEQENQPECEADEGLMKPTFAVISSSPSGSQVVKASRTTTGLATGLAMATANNITELSSHLLQSPLQLLRSVAPRVPTKERGRAHRSFRQGMTRHTTRAYAHATEIS